jgi:HTH-type transcriptional regulator / antitoxin HigA
MPVKTRDARLPSSYYRLVKEFPLTHIRDRREMEKAQSVIDRLLEKDLDAGEQEYLDALTDLVEAYEDDHEPIPDASEADVLRALLDASRLSQQKLAEAAGVSQSTISAVLNGNRSLTKQQLIAFSKFFQVSPAAFLPAFDLPAAM